jgi:5'-nucleotidase
MALVVLTNDDGIDAPGIRALQAALPPPHQIAVVAPSAALSGCSHQLNRGGVIKINPRGPDEYAIGGTPADCSRVALSHLYPQADWVLSGINAGGNMGSDTYVSGTVAAVREATLLRKAAIAISQYKHRDHPYDWARATRLSARVLSLLMAKELLPGEFWNVNLPAPTLSTDEPEIVFCSSCTQPLPTEFAIEKSGDEAGFRYVGAYENRLRDPGGDVAVCLGGQISVVKIQLW